MLSGCREHFSRWTEWKGWGGGEKSVTCESIYASDVLTVGRCVYIPTKCTGTLCISSAAAACLMCQMLPEFPCSFQGNMCAGILPQLRQGLAGSTVGTCWVWERRGSALLSFPHRHSASFSLTPVHRAASLPSFSPVTVPPLQSSTLTLSSFSTAVWSTPCLSSIYEILLSLSSL